MLSQHNLSHKQNLPRNRHFFAPKLKNILEIIFPFHEISGEIIRYNNYRLKITLLIIPMTENIIWHILYHGAYRNEVPYEL